MKLQNYVTGKWMEGSGNGQPLYDASTGELVATATSDCLNFEEMLNYGRKVGNKNLRKITFQERGRMLKALALYLMDRKEKYYENAFFGFENAVIPAGEIKDPQRNVPFALLVGLAVVIAVYVAIQAVTIGTLPDLASSERPLSDAAGVFMGPLGAAFIAAGACISIMGNLNVSLLGTSRILFAMGEENDLPGFLAATQKKFRTPHISLILSALAILLLTVWTSFLSALALATITRLLVYFTTCASLPIFRFRGAKEKAPFVAPMGIFASAASLCLIVWLLTRVDYYKEGLPVVVAVVAGLVIHLAYRAFRGAKGTTTIRVTRSIWVMITPMPSACP